MKKICSAIVLFAMFGMVNSAHAQAGTYAFGGRLSTVYYCSCMNAFWLTIIGPKPGSFIYYPGISMLYMNYVALLPGVNQLGLAGTASVPCMSYVGVGCSPIGAGMPILMMGTSVE